MARYVAIACSRNEMNTLGLEAECRARGIPYIRIPTDACSVRDVTLRYCSGRPWELRDERRGISVAPADIGAVWTRGLRPSKRALEGMHDSAQLFAQSEWFRAISAFLMAIEAPWMNHPEVLLSSINRLNQMAIGAEVGLSVPAWEVHAADQVAVTLPGELVTKIINPGGRAECGRAYLTTTRVPNERTELVRDAKIVPVLLQRKISARYIVRAYYIGGEVFAARAEIEFNDPVTYDSRQYNQSHAYYSPCTLPDHEARALGTLCRRLRLRFGAADFVVDESGRHWFLEVNPSGQWGWVENESYLPITAEIVSHLQSLAFG